MKLLMACDIKYNPKRDGWVNRVWARWSRVQSKYNLSFGSIVYHSPACLCFSGSDPEQLRSKECFLFDVNRSRNMFNIPATVPYSVVKGPYSGEGPRKESGEKDDLLENYFKVNSVVLATDFQNRSYRWKLYMHKLISFGPNEWHMDFYNISNLICDENKQTKYSRRQC